MTLAREEWAKYSQRLLCREATMSDVCTFIRVEKAHFPVAWICHKLGVARASFYRWLLPEELTPT